MGKLLIAAACAAAVLLAEGAPAHESTEHEHDAALGEVNFPVSCTPEARARFNVAVSLLYSFYWERIDAAVEQVLEADPACAMAWWVRAVASIDNALGSPPTPAQEAAGWAASQKAAALGGGTPRERGYIASVATFFRDHATVPFKARAAAYLGALEQLHREYPDDAEAALFYAFCLHVTADRNDTTYAQQLKSAAIIEKVFAAQPRHPGAAHFLIHAYDFPPIAEQGLVAARSYAGIAPDSPHALHMPSHIFSRVGAWQDSIDTNERSHAASDTARDAYHALDYMVFAMLQLARDDDAKRWADFVRSAPKPGEETRQVAYAGAAIPARHELERGDWAAAAKLDLSPAPAQCDWKRFPEGEAVNAYARGLGAARSGDAPAARREIERLNALRAAMAAQDKGYWVEQAGIQMDAIAAWAAKAEGRDEEALAGMRAAADREDRTEEHIMMPGRVIPVREMLGELLLELRRPEAALAEFERSLEADPNRLRNLYGAARAAELAGDAGKARRYYAQLVEQVGPDAARRREITQARAFLAVN